MSTPTDLEHDLRMVSIDFGAVVADTQRVRQHPRIGELCRIASEGSDPDHPATRLAATIDSEPGTAVGEYLVALLRALRDALAWLEGTNA
jgi:hypothetical protein